MKKIFFCILFYLFIFVKYSLCQTPCIGDLQVIVQGTSNGIPEGLIVKNSSDDGTNTLRNVIRCAQDGDTITYDQEGLIPVNASILTQELKIDKSLTIKGLNINLRPIINIDFTSLIANSGLTVLPNKKLTLKDVDLQETNNVNNKDIIKVEDAGMLKIMGKTNVIKN